MPSSPCSTELESPMSPPPPPEPDKEEEGEKGEGERSSRAKKKKSVQKRDSVADSIRIDFKALSSVFMEGQEAAAAASPTEASRRQSEEPEDAAAAGEEEDNEEDDCRCFGEETNTSSETNSFVEATNPHLRPVNTSAIDPDCSCDVEYELRVPEEPVTVFLRADSKDSEQPPRSSAEEEHLVKNLSNLPLQMRSSEEVEFRKPMPSSSSSEAATVPPKGKEDELSVRTLANMFDFKSLSSVPLRPCSARLEDSHLFQKAAKRMSSPASVDSAASAEAAKGEPMQSDC